MVEDEEEEEEEEEGDCEEEGETRRPSYRTQTSNNAQTVRGIWLHPSSLSCTMMKEYFTNHSKDQILSSRALEAQCYSCIPSLCYFILLQCIARWTCHGRSDRDEKRVSSRQQSKTKSTNERSTTLTERRESAMNFIHRTQLDGWEVASFFSVFFPLSSQLRQRFMRAIIHSLTHPSTRSFIHLSIYSINGNAQKRVDFERRKQLCLFMKISLSTSWTQDQIMCSLFTNK